MTIHEKILALFRSRRFWLAVAGTISIALQDVLGLSIEESQMLIGIFAAWILGDSLKHTE